MRKLFYAMSMLLAVALVWTGCSEPEPVEVEKFTVTYDSQGGNEVAPMTINKGAKITEPAKPTKADLIFAGWFEEATYVTGWNFSSDVVTADITLYAKWTTVEYTVTFETNGGSAIEPVKVAKGATFQAPLPPSKSGLAFKGWCKEAALTSIWDFSSDAVTADITLYADWTDISYASLRALFESTSNINSDNYTDESYSAMIVKKDAAWIVLDDATGASLVRIITAYRELQAAIDALVALPVREPVSIELYGNMVDGSYYVNPGEYFSIPADAVDAEENNATDSRVTFTYDEAKLAAWAQGDINVSTNYIAFIAKSELTAGETIDITIKSAAKPAISTTVKLKVAAVGELKAMFIKEVNALPAPDNISYDDWEAIERAFDIYNLLGNQDLSDDAVVVAYKKLSECEDVLDSLPTRLSYSFSGNVCTLTTNDFGETAILKIVFAAKGAFPQGTYTADWEDDRKGSKYTQYRLEFTSEKEGVVARRTSFNADGSDPTEWEKRDAFTYTFTGSKDKGGMFFLTFIDEEFPPAKGTMSGARGLFKR